MKIFAAGIATETNTFCPLPTSIEDFLVQRAHEPVVARPAFELAEIWGRPARTRGDEFVFSLMAWAQPGGTAIRSAYESLRDEILSDLRAAMPVDVVLLMLHGAMVAHGYDDCEEDMIRRVRQIVGPNTVIGVELDLHCHLTQAKIAAADIVITFKEYPHVDINDRAGELFDLCIQARLGTIRPTMALFDCHMIGQYPTSRQPLRGFVDAMLEAERRRGVLSISFGHGFQFADLPHVGAKVLVVTDNDRTLAEELAQELGLRAYGLRREIGLESRALPMEAALLKALASARKPVVVADQSDNPGAGAPGDATFALRWLLNHGVEEAALAIFYDPEVVSIARKAGIGAPLSVRLGGKTGPASGDPVDMNVTVLSIIRDYVHAFPQQSGAPVLFPLGDVAALRCGTLDIVVASARCQCYCPSIFRDLGIDATSKQLLIPKSTQHFAAAFAPIAGEIIHMVAPGAVPPDPRQIPFQRLDTQHLYPWTDDPLARGS